MAKRQSSLEAWLNNIPLKTARISDESENDNSEYSEMDYLNNSSSMSEADEAESSSDTVPCGCKRFAVVISTKLFNQLTREHYQR